MELLPFQGGGDCPVQYEVNYQGDEYYIRYRHSWLTIDKNDVDVFEQQLAHESSDDGYWSGTDTAVYLQLISKAIVDNDFANLVLPTVYHNQKDQIPVDSPSSSYYVEKRQRQWAALKPIYPSWGIALGAFLGGPAAVGYFLRENFVIFKKKRLAQIYWWSCISVAVLLYLGLLLLPSKMREGIPLILVPPLLLVAGFVLATGAQGKTAAAYQSFGGQRASLRSVLGYSLFWAVITALFVLFGLLTIDLLA